MKRSFPSFDVFVACGTMKGRLAWFEIEVMDLLSDMIMYSNFTGEQLKGSRIRGRCES